MKPPFLSEIEEDLRRESRALKQFEEALRSGEVRALADSIGPVDEMFVWKRAFRRIERLHSVSPDVRSAFLEVWLDGGDRIRQEVGDDLLLIRGLRVLLPSYEGPPVILYRGESVHNWKRRAYGLSWSASRDVGNSHASTGFYRTYQGGSVLLEAKALTEHIICAPAHHDNRYAEDEYLVDRRRLRGVKMLQRYSQLSHDEFNQLRATARARS